MTDPVSNYSGHRLHWDFRRGRRFAAGALVGGSPVAQLTTIRAAAGAAPTYDGGLATFAANATRHSDRGALVERTSTQLLTNSALIGAVLGEVGNGGALPIGWNVTPGVIPTNEGFANAGPDPSWCTVKVWFDNTGNPEIATVRLNLEEIGAVLVPASRKVCFSGVATVLELSNAFDPQLRTIIRNGAAELDGDDGATTIASLNTPTPFPVVPDISPTGVSVNPVATVRINAGAIGYMRIKLEAVQVEEGTSPTTWIRTTPDVYAGADLYPYYPFAGGADGTLGAGGLLPTGLSNSSMSLIEVLAHDTEETGDRTLRLTVIGNPTTERTGVLRLCPNNYFAAAPGQRWQAGLVARVISVSAGVQPRLSLAGRTSGGASTGPGGTTNLPIGRKAETLATGPMAALTQFASAAINVTAAAGTTAVVEIRLLQPTMRLMSLTAAASGPVVRDVDIVSIAPAATAFALPCTIMIDHEHRSLDPDQTALSIAYGNRRVRLLLGEQVGAVVEDGEDVLASLTQPANGAHGAMKLAVSITSTGISVGYPDGAGYGHASAALPALGNCTGAWLGSDNGAKPCTGFAREITVQAGAVPAANLAARTRDEWGPRHFRQRVGLSRPPALADVQAFAGNIVDTPGPTYSTFPIDRSARYYRRSNGGAAITSVLPSAAAANAAVAFFRITIINTGSGTNTITAPDGGIVTPTFEGTETSYVQPGNSYTMFVSDGVRWFWYTIAGAPFSPPAEVRCVSIYGPDRPGNENRDQLYGPNVAEFYAVIDNVRSMHAFVIEQMNAYVESGDLGAAARAARTLVEWCGADYWSGPTTLDQVGLSSLTNLPEAPIAVCYALFGIRFAGVLTAGETQVITDWIERRMQDTRIRFVPLRDQALADQIANGWTISGLQNHSWKWAMANALAAIALNRADYLADARQLFKVAMNDTAAVPATIGAFANEIARGDRCVNYEMLALSWLLGASEVLIGFGFDCYGYHDGIFVPAIDFAMRACDAPEIVTAEQTRMRDLGVTGTQYPITPTSQLGIGFGNAQDDSTGQFLFAESRVAAGYLGWRKVTDAQVAWKALWAPRWDIYENAYTSRVGGAQKTLYPLAPATPVVGLRSL